MQTFFYDQQIRRFILQFIRMLSNFQVEFGQDTEGNKALLRVPVFYGDASRQASQIIRGNSENALNNVPAIAVYVAGITYDRERVQEPTFVDHMSIRQRGVDPATGDLYNVQGGSYTVDRLMPVPYRLQLRADVWTSNTEQKLQLIEQLAILFNPALEIQSTSNYIDWTSLSYVLLTDISWSNRTVPIGAEEPIDIATLTFDLPIWLSAPVKIKQLGVVTAMANGVYDLTGSVNPDVIDGLNAISRKNIMPFGNSLSVLYTGNTLKLYNIKNPKAQWRPFIDMYGVLVNGISQVRFKSKFDDAEIVGTISYHPTDDTLLLFNVDQDTLPSNTLPPVDAIINPCNITNVDSVLNLAAGTRFLILEDIGDFSNTEGPVAWPGPPGQVFVAKANDIIEFNGTHWTVSFASRTISDVSYVTNLNTGVQYRWNGADWLHSYEGEYQDGEWSIVL